MADTRAAPAHARRGGRVSEAFLPYGHHAVDDDDIEAVVRVLRGHLLTGGPTVTAFEEALASKVGAPHAVACASGTAALHLSTLALELRPGDAVVVPTLTFLATANAARYVGADVIFADVDADSGLMEAEHLRATLARAGNAKAVIPVHINGQCGDMAALLEVAAEHSIAVIEDACHAVGAHYRDRNDAWRSIGDGAAGAMTVFSFHPVKTSAMGEGGAVTTGDPKLEARLRNLRNHGMIRDPASWRLTEQAVAANGAPNPWYYEMQRAGFNYRVSDIHCALGLSQLSKLERFVTRRQALTNAYDRALATPAPAVRPIARSPACQPAWHLYVVQIDFAGLGVDRATTMKRLHDAGIGSQVHDLPVHRQPYYEDLYGRQDLPGANAYYDRALSLPLFPAMADDDVMRVVAALTTAPGLDH